MSVDSSESCAILVCFVEYWSITILEETFARFARQSRLGCGHTGANLLR